MSYNRATDVPWPYMPRQSSCPLIFCVVWDSGGMSYVVSPVVRIPYLAACEPFPTEFLPLVFENLLGEALWRLKWRSVSWKG